MLRSGGVAATTPGMVVVQTICRDAVVLSDRSSWSVLYWKRVLEKGIHVQYMYGEVNDN